MMYDYNVECEDKKTKELTFFLPVVATSYKKAKEIAEKYLETVKGVPSIDYSILVKRTYPGRDVKVITEEDVTPKCSYCSTTENLGTQEGIIVCKDCAMGEGQ